MRINAYGLGFLIVIVSLVLFLLPGISAISVTDCGNTELSNDGRGSASYGLVINTTSDLDNNIISNGTCIIINASFVNFSCEGFSITYGVGTNETANQSFGILLTNVTNVNITGCSNITDGNSSAGNIDIAINISRANNTIISNNNLTSNATVTGFGIYALEVNNLSIINTTFIIGAGNAGTTGSATAIYVRGGKDVTIRGGSITMNATENATGIDLDSVNTSLVAGITFMNINTLNGRGRGITLRGAGSQYNIFENNTINLTASSGARNYGIEFLLASLNNATNNVINATGTTDNYGIFVHGVNNVNRFHGLTLRTNGTSGGYGLYLNITNFTVLNHLNFSDVAQWMYINQSFSNNLTNATFNNTLNGTILFPGAISLNAFHTDVTKAKMNISTLGIAYVNSTNLSIFNTTARIQIIGIRFDDPSFIAPEPQISYADTISPTFTECPTDICTLVSYVQNVFTFNVTQFSSYQAGAATVNRCQVVNRSASLNVSINGSMGTAPCIVINASNIDFNCNNFTITGTPANQTIGIIATDKQGITIRNCNLTNFSTAGIFINNSPTGILVENHTFRNNSVALYLWGTNYSNTRHNNFTNNTRALLLANASQFNNVTNSSYGNNTNNTYVIHLLNSLNNVFNQSQNVVTQNDVDFIAGRIIVEDPIRSKIDFNNSDVTNITAINNFNTIVSYPSTGEVRLANTANTTSLNRSARITFFGVTTSDPRPMVDYENDNSYTQCADCQELSYASGNYTYDVTHFTSYSYEQTPSGGGSTSGGGGGGAAAPKTYSLTAPSQSFSLKNNEKIAFTLNKAPHLITIISINVKTVTVKVTSPAQTFTLAPNVAQLVDVDLDGKSDIRLVLTSISSGRATITVELLGSACVESWTCSDWADCTSGTQTRTCDDIKSCGTTKLKPKTTQACTMPVSARTEPPAAEAEIVPEPAPEQIQTFPEPARQRSAAQALTMTNIFYGIALLALIALGVYWYAQSRKRAR